MKQITRITTNLPLYGHKGLIWWLFIIVFFIVTNEMQSNHNLSLQKANNSNLSGLLSCKQWDKMCSAQKYRFKYYERQIMF